MLIHRGGRSNVFRLARCRMLTPLGLGLSPPFRVVCPLATLHWLDLLFVLLVSMSGMLFSSGSSNNLTDSSRLSLSLEFSVTMREHLLLWALDKNPGENSLSAKITCPSLKHCGWRVGCSGEACTECLRLGFSAGVKVRMGSINSANGMGSPLEGGILLTKEKGEEYWTMSKAVCTRLLHRRYY